MYCRVVLEYIILLLCSSLFPLWCVVQCWSTLYSCCFEVHCSQSYCGVLNSVGVLYTPVVLKFIVPTVVCCTVLEYIISLLFCISLFLLWCVVVDSALGSEVCCMLLHYIEL